MIIIFVMAGAGESGKCYQVVDEVSMYRQCEVLCNLYSDFILHISMG